MLAFEISKGKITILRANVVFRPRGIERRHLLAVVLGPKRFSVASEKAPYAAS